MSRTVIDLLSEAEVRGKARMTFVYDVNEIGVSTIVSVGPAPWNMQTADDDTWDLYGPELPEVGMPIQAFLNGTRIDGVIVHIKTESERGTFYAEGDYVIDVDLEVPP